MPQEQPIDKIIFDLDNTLIKTTELYMQAIQDFTEYLQRSGLDMYTQDEIKSKQEEIDLQLVEQRGFSLERFQLSFVETYKTLLKPTEVQFDPAVAENCRDIAASVKLTPEKYKQRGWKSQANKALEGVHGDYELALFTKGDPDIQWRKINGLNLTRWFPEENIHICDHKTPNLFHEVIDPHTPGETYKIGDSIRSDINPMLNLGGHAINVTGGDWAYEKDDLITDYPGDFHTVPNPEDILDIL
jgi:putative hydrolase of the HAD superfamily